MTARAVSCCHFRAGHVLFDQDCLAKKWVPGRNNRDLIFKNRFKGSSATRSCRSIGRDMRWWCDPSPDGTLWLNPIFPKNVFFRKRRFLPKAVAIPQGWVGIEGLNPMKQKCGYSFWKLPEAPNLQSLVVCLSLAQRNNFLNYKLLR